MAYFKTIKNRTNKIYNLNKYQVALCFNDKYFFPAVNTMNSIAKHNSNTAFICLCSNLTKEHEDYLLDIDRYGVRLIELEWAKEIDTRFYSIEVAFNVYIPWIVPELDKVLYIDPDMICKGNIENIFDEDYLIAMSPEISGMVEELNKSLFNVSPTAVSPIYFNSGTCFMNCKQIRSIHSMNEIDTEFIDKIDQYYLLDQDFLNVFYAGDIHPLPISWNTQFYEFSDGYFYKKAIEKALLIHFSFHKPWRHTSSFKQSKLYLSYCTNSEIIHIVKKARRERLKRIIFKCFYRKK